MKRFAFILSAVIGLALQASAMGEQLSPTGLFGKISYFTCPAQGETRFPVVLVEFQDVKFADSISAVIEHFEGHFNGAGYTGYGATGSVREYFTHASDGRFTPVFDFYGCVTLTNDRSYYGANNTGGVDKNNGDMIIEAITAMADKIDFSKYDSNGDKSVDAVILIYAGNDEYTGGTDAPLPKSYILQYDKYNDRQYSSKGMAVTDGYYVNAYTIINELSDGVYDGLGTFVHEFMHGLGLADVYNTYETGAAYTPRYYDVMDVGIYNNDSRTPPTTSTFERFSLGWFEPEIIDESCEITLLPLSQKANGYAIPVSDTEIFFFEARDRVGWDAYLPGEGMLVWHIAYKQATWYTNTANRNGTNQLIDLIEAGGFYTSRTDSMATYPFPGTLGVTTYTPVAKSGEALPYTFSNITRHDDGSVTATVTYTSSAPLVTADECTYYVNGRTLTVSREARVYDLTGRCMASGFETVTLPAGIYILTTPKAHKIIIR